jgi:hypothetical protein
MLILVALLATGTAEDVNLRALVDQAELRMQVPECQVQSCRTNPSKRYRLTNYQPDIAPGSKDRAFADDGTYCGVVGDKRCLSGRHAIFRSGESPMHTILSSLP